MAQFMVTKFACVSHTAHLEDETQMSIAVWTSLPGASDRCQGIMFPILLRGVSTWVLSGSHAQQLENT